MSTNPPTEKSLKEDRSAKLADLEALHNRANGRAFTNEEHLEFNRLEGEVKDIDRRLKAHSRRLENRARGVDQQRARPRSPMAYALEELGNKREANVTQANLPSILEKRTFDSTDGAALIPSERIVDDSLIAPIYSGPFEQLGIDVETGLRNHTSRVVYTSVPAAQVVAEGVQIPESTAIATAKTFDFVNIDINMPVTADTIRDADVNVYGDVADLFTVAIQHELLRQATKGDSANGEMVGIDNAAGVQSLSHSSATLTYDVIVNAVKMAMAANAQRENLRVLMNPTAWQQLQALKDTTGQQIEMPEGLRDIPFVVHTSIANDYGVGNDETRVYVGDFSSVKLGVGGTYDLTTQHLKADFDIINFIMVYRCDMQLMFPDHIVRIEDVATA